MKNSGTTARRSMTVAFGVGAALVIGVAFAAWVQTGTGSGSASSISAQNSVVTTDTVTATANADLYPNAGATAATAGDVYFKVTNPNPYPVKFTSMAATSVASSDEAACPAANVTVSGKSGLAITVPANTTTAVAHKIDGVVAMAKTAPNGCQNKTFTIGLTLTGESD